MPENKSEPHILFFLGKGGVGKSTLSSLVSLALSSKKRIMLTSLDPAHNLSDLFELSFSEKPIKVNKNLSVIEIDLQLWIKKYLKETQQAFERSYSYLTSFSLDKHFSLIKHAPAIEEQALNNAFFDIIKKHNNIDVFVFDMPPTALALKFFSYSSVNLLWINKLIDLRRQILKKEKMLTRITLGTKEIERDKVLLNLQSQYNFWITVQNRLKHKSTKIITIENPEKLSQAEATRIQKNLQELEISNTISVLNRALNNNLMDRYKFSLSKIENNSIGLDQLKKIAGNINTEFLNI